jgi:hypothetical protein
MLSSFCHDEFMPPLSSYSYSYLIKPFEHEILEMQPPCMMAVVNGTTISMSIMGGEMTKDIWFSISLLK